MLWAVFTVLAAAAQTARNAMQRDLVERVGVVGATHVRFLFGFPFALVFLAGMSWLTRDAVPEIPKHVLPVVLGAALSQIAATGLMLQAMRLKSFTVATAYTKTEPVLVALFGLVFLAKCCRRWRSRPSGSRRSACCSRPGPRRRARAGRWKPWATGL